MIFDTFAAANTKDGFYDFFDQIIDFKNNKNVYLIKGGPGTGKSTFLKNIADKADSKGMTVEKIHCSSDSDSLDGVKIFDKSITLIDATSPHCYDPSYPGAFDNIINMGAFWDAKKLEKSKNEIKNISDDIKKCYESAYHFLSAAGQTSIAAYKDILSITQTEKIKNYVKKIIRQNAITNTENLNPDKHKRFLSGYCPMGKITFTDTILNQCETILVFDDAINISSCFLNLILNYLCHAGYDVFVYYHPLMANKKIEHIVVPSLKTGFITKSSFLKADDLKEITIKTIQTKTFVNKALYKNMKNKLSFAKKLTNELENEAIKYISKAKSLHDELESYYISAMDFISLNEYSKEITDKIL